MSDKTNKLVEEYKAEYRRTTGEEATVTVTRGWVKIGWDNHRVKELPTFIARLKARPTFNTDSPKTNIMGDPVTPAEITMKSEGEWLVLTRKGKFLGYIARNGWSGKTAFCNYKIGVPVLGSFTDTLSVDEMRDIVHRCNEFFGMGGQMGTGKADLADAITERLDHSLQRAGIVWPCHETAAMIRQAINDYKLGKKV
jgi:hypothetical protein